MIKNQKKLVIVLAGLVVLVIAGYYLISGKKQSATETPVADTAVGTDKNSVPESTVDQTSSSSVLIMSGIKLNIPPTWTTKKESDSNATVSIPGIKSSATLAVSKCEEFDNKACFGSAQFNYKKTANGGIVDLGSTLNMARFGVELGKNDSPSSYEISFTFSDKDYQLSQAQNDMLRDVAMTAAFQ